MAGDSLITRKVRHGRIELVLGNIVEQQADAIVNAANTKLKGGGGVDGAIHRAAGPALKKACLELPAADDGRRCPTGEVRVTAAGDLPAKFVIHAVGPFYNARYAEKGARQLREVYANALAAAAKHKCRSVALPSISTGAYRFPIQQAAEIALQAAVDFLQQESSVEVIRFVLYKPPHLQAFKAALEDLD
jgi:O-acetyl-ADP-ribose deacetylase (regulator of RNase III)